MGEGGGTRPLRTCETCGLTFEPASNARHRWCLDCRVEGERRARLARQSIPTQRGKERVDHALALTVTEQTLHIRMAYHALGMAAWARQLGWDDTTHLQAAMDALTTIPITADLTIGHSPGMLS